MTQTRRIIFNVLATYGRSLLVMFCGLFTSRWVLQALGTEAYGVFGVVGTIIGLVTIFNGMLSSSISRYYAYAYGQASVATDRSIAEEECCRWFNVALLVHAVIPTIFVIIGLFVGDWAIDNYFSIPAVYRPTAHWVLYFTLVSVIVGVLNAPFRALFVAQQLIAELTIFDVIVPILNIACAWWLLHYTGDRLFFNSLYAMLLGVIPNLLIALRALYVFPACRIDVRKMWDLPRIKQLFAFAGWQVVSWISYTMQAQGVAIIVNKLLGIRFNATMTVANTVSSKASTLSNALTGAFAPAVTNAAGAQNDAAMRSLALRSCKFGTLLCAIFAIPLMVEIDYVINLWLTTIPPAVTGLCVILLINLVVDKMSGGLQVAVWATGNIKKNELGLSVCFLICLTSTYLFVRVFHLGIYGVGLGYLVLTLTCALVKLYLWKWQLGFPLGPWIRFAVMFALAFAITVIFGLFLKSLLPPSFVRLCVVGGCCVLVFSIFCYRLVLDEAERNFIIQRIVMRFRKTKPKKAIVS